MLKRKRETQFQKICRLRDSKFEPAILSCCRAAAGKTDELLRAVRSTLMAYLCLRDLSEQAWAADGSSFTPRPAKVELKAFIRLRKTAEKLWVASAEDQYGKVISLSLPPDKSRRVLLSAFKKLLRKNGFSLVNGHQRFKAGELSFEREKNKLDTMRGCAVGSLMALAHASDPSKAATKEAIAELMRAASRDVDRYLQRLDLFSKQWTAEGNWIESVGARPSRKVADKDTAAVVRKP